jgi:hypothetical protein
MVREVLRPRAIQRPCVIPVEIVTKPALFFTCDDPLMLVLGGRFLKLAGTDVVSDGQPMHV